MLLKYVFERRDWVGLGLPISTINGNFILDLHGPTQQIWVAMKRARREAIAVPDLGNNGELSVVYLPTAWSTNRRPRIFKFKKNTLQWICYEGILMICIGLMLMPSNDTPSVPVSLLLAVGRGMLKGLGPSSSASWSSSSSSSSSSIATEDHSR